MTKLNITWLASLAIILFAFSCNDDNIVTPPGEEIITTLNFTLTPENGGDAVVLSFNDPDGDGGNAPTITVENLAANTNYDGAITLSNESVTPTEDITAEVQEEDDEHQFFFDTTVGELRHQPNKSGDNVASGDITNAGGETDIEVTFDVTIE